MKMIQHLALSCLVALSLTIVFSTAFTQSFADISNGSLRSQALIENTISENQKKNSITDARVEGMLSLKDPRLDVATRKIKYTAQFTAQQFKASGKVRSDLNYNFDLDKSNTTLMPGVALGFKVPTYSSDTIKTNIALSAKASYSNQATDVVFPSGYTEPEVRLSTLLLGVNSSIGLSAQRFSWLEMNLGMEFGDLNYTQTSNNDLATFSKHANYRSWNVGFNFEVSRDWFITTNYAQRKLNANDSLQLQSNNYELGTQILW